MSNFFAHFDANHPSINGLYARIISGFIFLTSSIILSKFLFLFLIFIFPTL